LKLQGIGPSLEVNPLVGSMRIRVTPAAHSNEIAAVNKDGASFMNARAVLSGMGKLILFLLKTCSKWGCQVTGCSHL
jgi:hypothetical protein